jgi:hypothetical protein
MVDAAGINGGRPDGVPGAAELINQVMGQMNAQQPHNIFQNYGRALDHLENGGVVPYLQNQLNQQR